MSAEVHSQEEYFQDGGGDAYFNRNFVGQDAPRRDYPVLQFLLRSAANVLPKTGRACVLGGAGGREAAALAELLPGWTLSNVDISARAIDFGREVFPHINHYCRSIADADLRLSSELEPQDLVLAVGILLWIDRRFLSRAIANIDEIVCDGGHLLIRDFFPSTNRKNAIEYAPNNFTYKQNYSAPFLSLGTYELVAVDVDVASEPANLDDEERKAASFLLHKNLHGLYPIGRHGSIPE